MAVHARPQQDGGSKKWLWGCCGGCLGLVFLAIALVAVGLYFLIAIPDYTPSKNSIDCPSARRTIAFFHSGLRPAVFPTRLNFRGWRMV